MIKTQEPNLIDSAYFRLYKKNCSYDTTLSYSNRFKPFGANIRYRKQSIQVNLSTHWKDISEDIVIGLLQELLLKIWKIRPYPQTLSLDLYHRFIRELPDAVPKTDIDSELKVHFDHINDIYFLGQLSCPNIRWGKYSRRRFGSYNFKTDTITLSPVLQEVDQDILRYVLFHEMLHKLHKFEMSGSRAQYHTSRFKHLEKQYTNGEHIERQLQRIANGTYGNAKPSVSQSTILSRISSPKKTKTTLFQEIASAVFPKKK